MYPTVQFPERSGPSVQRACQAGETGRLEANWGPSLSAISEPSHMRPECASELSCGGESLKDSLKLPCTFQLALKPNLFWRADTNCLFMAQENSPAASVKKHKTPCEGAAPGPAGKGVTVGRVQDRFQLRQTILLPGDSPCQPPGGAPI